MSPNLPMNEDDVPNDETYNDESHDNPALLPDVTEEFQESDDSIRISLLKQYTYCPRVAYYETCIPHIRPTTYKMLAGEEEHERERERAARRTLFAYQIKEGDRHFDVRLTSPLLGLTGIIDEVVVMKDRCFVVDYKLADYVGENHEIQLTAYALLVEEAFGRPVEQGYIYLLKTKKFESMPITASFRNSVSEMIQSIHHMRLTEYFPPPTKQARKCETCEFRRFCTDI